MIIKIFKLLKNLIVIEDSKHEKKIRGLFNKIETIKSNPDYRIADVIYKKGIRWNDSKKKIINEKKYFDTILYKYLNTNKKDIVDLKLLKKIIIREGTIKDFQFPKKNELVVHIRAGDVVEFDWMFLSKDYLKEINNYLLKFKHIENISFVICFSYQEYKEKSTFMYNKKKQNKNETLIKKFLKSVFNQFYKYNINIISNTIIDKDIVYCATAKYFISDIGGFSELMKELTDID